MSYSLQETETFAHPLLKRICKSARRRMGEAGRRERRPITRDILLRLLKRLDTIIFDDVNMHVAFCLAFADSLRVDEFTYIKVDAQTNDFDEWFVTRNHIVMSDDNLTLIISSSKIDFFRGGISIPIVVIGDVACPLRFLRHLYATFSAKGNTPLFQISNGFSRQHVIATLRRMLLDIGIKGRFSGHFFRRGVATWAEIRGLSRDEIRVLGRWKSDSYLLYIDRGPKRALAYSRRFQAMK